MTREREFCMTLSYTLRLEDVSERKRRQHERLGGKALHGSSTVSTGESRELI